jgi:sugar lactone lactonase YvrE
VVLAAACGGRRPDPPAVGAIAVVRGLSGPEAVRYDPDQDVWFVANFNGAEAGDANGFITRVGAGGEIHGRRFMTGRLAPLHGPRGMFITGDTLWAADADGVHGFDRRDGAHLVFVDFRPLAPGFLNDIAQGPDGALYVTDTGRDTPRVYRLAGRAVTIAVEDSALGPPNGITWDAAAGRFLLAGWGEGGTVTAWRPGGPAIATIGTARTGRFDGIELVDGAILVASQTDSSLHEIRDGTERVLIKTAGQPADIGVDTKRRRVAVPYLDLDRVDIWDLPASP